MTLTDSPFVPDPYDPWSIGFDRVQDKYGHNTDLNAASGGEDIIGMGGDAVLPTAVGDLTIVSSSTDDDAAGTGATEITVSYLDVNWQQQTAVLATDGTTPVSASANALRAPRAKVTGAGSGEAAVGTISIAIGGTTVNIIEIGTAAMPTGQTLFCCDTIPTKTEDGFTVVSARILGWQTQVLGSGLGEIEFGLYERPFGQVWQIMGTAKVDAKVNGNPPLSLWPVPLTINPRSDLKVRATKITGNNQVAAANFWYYLVL